MVKLPCITYHGCFLQVKIFLFLDFFKTFFLIFQGGTITLFMVNLIRYTPKCSKLRNLFYPGLSSNDLATISLFLCNK